MTNRQRLRVGRSFQRGADAYDQHTPVQQRVVQQLINDLEQQVLVQPRGLLDIGCGTGWLLAQLAQRYPDAALTGLDLASTMLRHADLRLAGKATLVQGDAEQLPFENQCFDLVVSSSTFQWLEQCGPCFGEVHRVLQNGGWFCFALFGAGTLYELQSSWRGALRKAGKPFVEGQDGTHHFHTRDEIQEALRLQGFSQVEVSTQKEVVWYSDLPQLLQAIKRIGAGTARPPVGGGLGWRRVLHEMAAIYTEQYGAEQGVPASYQVIYGRGSR